MSESQATSAPSTALRTLSPQDERAKEMKPERANVTLKDIARRCGVETRTVGRALSGKGRVSHATTERVRAIAQELGYSIASNRTARRMSSIRLGKPFTNQAVAVFLPFDFYRANYYNEIQGGIFETLAGARYDLLTAQWDTLGNLGEPARLPHAVLAGEVDGAIAIEPELAGLLRALPSFGARPIVGIINQFEQCASVQADDEEAACLAAGHLLDLGHRHILHFFLPEGETRFPASRRVEGYHRACRERGLDPHAVLHGFFMPEDWPHAEWRVRHLWEGLKRYPETTALLAPNDEDAHVLYDALINAGRRVPEEISMVSMDDVRAITDEHGRNILTTVDLSLRAIGETAGRLLVELVTGKVSGIVRRTMPAHLVVRASTAGPRPRTSEAR